ncbi:MAG TPA: ABC transporter ATP-binding protein [Chromatiales bacterium]|nr:ABC transporter ATP-binding protein [Chromatiales bacterium]
MAAPKLEALALAVRHVGPLSLALADGACAGLTGPSGAGKTLLLRALADLEPHTGEVRLDGRPASAFRPHEWRRRVMWVPAEPGWWAETVGEHLDGADDALLARLGFGPEVRGWSVRRLSSGERQRLGLARALARGPEVLLLDEPTASLDAHARAAVEALLAGWLRPGRAMLWVSHDLGQLARVATAVWRLEGGRLREAAP